MLPLIHWAVTQLPWAIQIAQVPGTPSSDFWVFVFRSYPTGALVHLGYALGLDGWTQRRSEGRELRCDTMGKKG